MKTRKSVNFSCIEAVIALTEHTNRSYKFFLATLFDTNNIQVDLRLFSKKKHIFNDIFISIVIDHFVWQLLYML